MTPYEIEILLHHTFSQDPFPRNGALLYVPTVDSLCANGLLRKMDGGHYEATDRGKAHIKQLCRTPWPIQAWVDKDGKEI